MKLVTYLFDPHSSCAPDSILTEFSCRLDELHQKLFTKYCKLLDLAPPIHGFLAEDCFTPSGSDECLSVIEYSTKEISKIAENLGLCLYLRQLLNKPLNNTGKLIAFLQEIYQHVYVRRSKLNNNLSRYFINQNYLFKLGKITSHRLIATLLTCILNLVFEGIYISPKIETQAIFAVILASTLKNLTELNLKIEIVGITSFPATGISYRDEGRGKGAFFDHYTLQRVTGAPTRIINTLGQGRRGHSDLYIEITNNPLGLIYGEDYLGKYIPFSLDLTNDVHDSGNDWGLLFIPGRARETQTKRPAVFNARQAKEREFIRQARIEGRPIIAVCAGAWVLYEAFGGTTTKVKNHCARRMPGIKQDGDIGYNMHIHDVRVPCNTMLSGAMGLRKVSLNKSKILSANSVHWLAADPETCPPDLTICAYSQKSDADSDVEENTVEAFETLHGAPVFGVQLHPEAYNNSPDKASQAYRALLNYSYQAGVAFFHKRRVLKEFKEHFVDVKANLKEVNIMSALI